MPVKKSAMLSVTGLAELLRKIRTTVKLDSITDHRIRDEIEKLLNVDYESELTWYQRELDLFLHQHNPPIVFCHNDPHRGNIIIPDDDSKGKIMLVDFESASYNYRGFDIAIHFIDHFTPDVDNGLSEEEIISFAGEYFDEWMNLHNGNVDSKRDTIENLIQEAKIFIPFRLLICIIFSIDLASRNLADGSSILVKDLPILVNQVNSELSIN